MYVMYGYQQFSGETCHLVYLELGLNFQLLFPSQTMRRLRVWQSLRSQTNHAPSVCAVPHYCPTAKQ